MHVIVFHIPTRGSGADRLYENIGKRKSGGGGRGWAERKSLEYIITVIVALICWVLERSDAMQPVTCVGYSTVQYSTVRPSSSGWPAADSGAGKGVASFLYGMQRFFLHFSLPLTRRRVGVAQIAEIGGPSLKHLDPPPSFRSDPEWVRSLRPSPSPSTSGGKNVYSSN
jgi:hypothetical protein